MAAILVLSPLTDRGRTLIDRLERETGERPSTVNHGTGDRAYYLGEDGPETFEAMLERMDADWREHVARSMRQSAPRFSRVLRRPSPKRDSIPR